MDCEFESSKVKVWWFEKKSLKSVGFMRESRKICPGGGVVQGIIVFVWGGVGYFFEANF